MTEVQKSDVAEGTVLDPYTSVGVNEVLTRYGIADTLTREAMDAAFNGGDEARTEWRRKALDFQRGIAASETVAAAYMVRFEDTIARKEGGKDKASYDDILAAYRELTDDPERVILKSRVSQLRNAAIVLVDLEWPLDRADAAWMIGKATTGKLPVKFFHAALATAQEKDKGPEEGRKILLAAREELAKPAATEATESTTDTATESTATDAPATDATATDDTATGGDTASREPQHDASGNGVEKDSLLLGVGAAPLKTAEDVARLLIVQHAIAHRIGELDAALVEAARKLADLDDHEAAAEAIASKRAARKATPATVRKSTKA